jgi:hypothetical protein
MLGTCQSTNPSRLGDRLAGVCRLRALLIQTPSSSLRAPDQDLAASRNADDRRRQEFVNQAHARMLKAIDSQTNFVMMNIERLTIEIVERFRPYGILLPPPVPSFEKYLRVSPGVPTEMREFWEVWTSCPFATRRSKAKAFGTTPEREGFSRALHERAKRTHRQRDTDRRRDCAPRYRHESERHQPTHSSGSSPYRGSRTKRMSYPPRALGVDTTKPPSRSNGFVPSTNCS